MLKLVNAYRKLPSPTNRRKLQEYITLDYVALCKLSSDNIAFLRANNFKL